jgi:antitoxin (DNA-binding transcriptional repressor) of toxin-antitoxin stability system
MRVVNISVLKAQLSAHIEMVRNGEEVLVCDRNEPVARIMTPPLKKRRPPVSWPDPPGNISDEVMEQLWREERDR